MEQVIVTDIRKEHHDILTAALESMQKQMFLTDVIIKCGDQEFAAHRVILSAGSPYFRAMFSNDMFEANSGKVEFKDISPYSMQVVLEFVYTGHVGDTEKNVEKVKDILSAAHLLQVNLLYDYCWKLLQNTLSVDQCVYLWELAELYQNAQMLETIVKYIAENFLLVMVSSEFLSLPTCKLESVLKHPLMKASSDVLVKKLIEWAQHMEQDERKEDLLRLVEYVDFDSLSNEFISTATNDEFIKTSSSLLCKLLTVVVSRADINTSTPPGNANSHPLSSSFNQKPECPVKALLIFIEPYYLYVLNLKTKVWRPCKYLPFELQCGMTSVFNGETVLFIGGGKLSKQASANILKYDLDSNSHKIMTTMHHSLFCPGAVKLGQKLYVLGGKNEKSEPLRNVEVYNMDDEVWTTAASTITAHFSPNVITVDTTIFVVGSCGQHVIESYNATVNQWSYVTSMPRNVDWPLRVSRHKQFIWAVDCIKRKAHIYNVADKTWLSTRILVTKPCALICSVTVTADQRPFLIAMDGPGVLYEVDPDTREEVFLAANKQLTAYTQFESNQIVTRPSIPVASKWLHLN